VLKAGKRQDVVEMFLYDDEQNLVGHATDTFMVLPGVELP
jgi:acyl-coenzyme A thioesterase PaaI-like protein